MTPDELRALADALEPMARAPRFEDFDVPGFCAWVRACAEAKPVAWTARHTSVTRFALWLFINNALARSERAAQKGSYEPVENVAKYQDDAKTAEEARAMLAAAPAAPQAAPMADSDADYWLRNRQSILDGIERAGFMLMSNASGFWLHPRGKTDAQAGPIDPHMIVAEDRFPDAQVEPKREDQPLRDLLAVIHCDGGHHTEAVGLDQSIKDAQAAVYVLKRELAMAKRDPVLIDLLKQAEKCLAAGVRVDQTAPDEPPISEWDYEADRLSAEIFAWMKVHGIGGSDD